MPQANFTYADFQQFQQEALQARLMNDAFGKIALICKQRDKRRVKWKNQLLEELANALGASYGLLIEKSEENTTEWAVVATQGIDIQQDKISLEGQSAGLLGRAVAKKSIQTEKTEQASLQATGSLQISSYHLLAFPVVVANEVIAVFQFSSNSPIDKTQQGWLNNISFLLEGKFAYHAGIENLQEYDKEAELYEKEEDLKTSFAELQAVEVYQQKLEEANQRIKELEERPNLTEDVSENQLAEKLQIAFKTIDRLEEKLNQAKDSSAKYDKQQTNSTIQQYEARLEEAFLTIERLEKRLIESKKEEGGIEAIEYAKGELAEEKRGLLAQLVELEKQKEELSSELSGLRLNESENNNHDTEALAEANRKLEEARKEIHEAEGKLAQAKVENELLHQQAKLVGSEKSQQVDDLSATLEDLKGKFSEQAWKNEQLKEEYRQERQKQEEEVSALQKELVEAKTNAVDSDDLILLQLELDELSTKLASREQAFADLEEKHRHLALLVDKHKELAEKTELLEREKEGLHQAGIQKEAILDDLKRDLEAQKEVSRSLEELQVAFRQKEIELESITKQLNDSLSENQQIPLLKAELAELSMQTGQLQTELQEARKVVSEREQVIAQLEINIEQLKEDKARQEENTKSEITQMQGQLEGALFRQKNAEDELNRKTQELASLENRIKELDEAEYKINSANMQVRNLSSKLDKAEHELSQLRYSLNGYSC